MARIAKTCSEVIDRAEWIALATSGTDGPHLVATWAEYVRALGTVDDEVLLVPVGGYRQTERNLAADDRIELLCGTRLVQGTSGPGKGCRIRGRGHIQTSGEQFEATKRRFPWARGVLVVKIEEVSEQL